MKRVYLLAVLAIVVAAALGVAVAKHSGYVLVSYGGFRYQSGLWAAMFAFALSFDEVYVTIFTAPPGVDTLPLWIMNQMARPNEANVVNVVATVVILASFIPVWVSQRLSRDVADRD